VEQLETLRILNDTDRWIERVVAQREHLPELEELASVEAELRSLLAALQEAQQSAEPVRRSYLGAQETARRLSTRAVDLEVALASSTGSARDLSAVQRELEQVRERVGAAEDDELNFLLELEPLDETIGAIKARAQPGVARRAQLQADVTQLRATLDDEVAALRGSRAEMANSLEPGWRQRYDAALSRAGISGAAYVDAGRCDGCRIALSPLDLDRFRHLEAGVVMDCPECGRLLLP
jgi:hypothetical protein